MKEALPRVIVVEDEPQIRHFVCDALKHEGCAANEAGSVRQGLDAAASGTPALVILDLGLPDGSGLEFIHDFRTWSRAPILILSARSAEQDKIEALDAGADDYLTKPFGVGELLARVRALLRRNAQSAEATPLHRFGEVEVDLSRRVVTVPAKKFTSPRSSTGCWPRCWPTQGRWRRIASSCARSGVRGMPSRDITCASTSAGCARSSNPIPPSRNTS
jgi:DNA-binding response OmpR family regulator